MAKRTGVLGSKRKSDRAHGMNETPESSQPKNTAPPTVNTPDPTAVGVGPVISPDRIRRTAVLPGNSRSY